MRCGRLLLAVAAVASSSGGAATVAASHAPDHPEQHERLRSELGELPNLAAVEVWWRSLESAVLEAFVPTCIAEDSCREKLQMNMVKGNIVPQQARYYMGIVAAANKERAKNAGSPASASPPSGSSAHICETGYFRGVSSHLWLTASGASPKLGSNSTVTLSTFDVGFPKGKTTRLHSRKASDSASLSPQRLSELFASATIHQHAGDSAKTLADFKPKEPCEVVSVDGSHEAWGPYDDFVQLHRNTMPGAWVLFDDTFFASEYKATVDGKDLKYNWCTRSYWRLVKEGYLEHVGCVDFGKKIWYFNLKGGVKGELEGPISNRFPKGFCAAKAKVMATEV